jgi:hypothetical protein
MDTDVSSGEFQQVLLAEENFRAKLEPVGERSLNGVVWTFDQPFQGRRSRQVAKSFPAERTRKRQSFPARAYFFQVAFRA